MSIGILLLEVREDVGIRAGVIAEPVEVVNPHVAEHLHEVLHLLGHRRLRPLSVSHRGRRSEGDV